MTILGCVRYIIARLPLTLTLSFTYLQVENLSSILSYVNKYIKIYSYVIMMITMPSMYMHPRIPKLSFKHECSILSRSSPNLKRALDKMS